MVAIETSQSALPVSAKAALHARKNIRYKIFPLTKCPYMLFYHCFVLNFTLIKLQYEPIAQSFPRRRGWLECAAGVRGHEFLLIKRLNMPFIPYISWNLLGFTIMRTGRPALSTSAEAGKHSESGRHGFLPIICLIMQFFLYIFWNLQRSEVDGASGTTQTASCSKATLLAFGKDASKGASGFAFRKV